MGARVKYGSRTSGESAQINHTVVVVGASACSAERCGHVWVLGRIEILRVATALRTLSRDENAAQLAFFTRVSFA